VAVAQLGAGRGVGGVPPFAGRVIFGRRLGTIRHGEGGDLGCIPVKVTHVFVCYPQDARGGARVFSFPPQLKSLRRCPPMKGGGTLGLHCSSEN
jgi:hypothetical protein